MKLWLEKHHRRHQSQAAMQEERRNAWDSYKFFTAASSKPIPSTTKPMPETAGPIQDWIAYGSWSYCDKCFRRRPYGVATISSTFEVKVDNVCYPCDHKANASGKCSQSYKDLPKQGWRHYDEEAIPKEQLYNTEQIYVCPRPEDWPVYDADANVFKKYDKDTKHLPSMLYLTKEEAEALAIITLHCDYKQQKGQKGTAPVANIKKLSVIRAEWKRDPIEQHLPTDRAKAAYQWLHDKNERYRYYVNKQRAATEAAQDPSYKLYIPTAELLLNMDGIEVAARPVLYPHPAYGDTDHRNRLTGYCIQNSQRPNAKTSYLRKCLSMCTAYMTDFMLLFLIYDIATARQTLGKIATAENKGLSPDILADNKQNSESFWRHEQDILSDVVRQMEKKCTDKDNYPVLWDYCNSPLLHTPRSLAFPNVFITIAPAEWTFLLNNPLFHRYKYAGDWTNPADLGDVQGPMALHIYNVLMTIMKGLLAKNKFFDEVYEWCIRVEFQGRGTLHIHIALWAIVNLLNDLRGTSGEKHNSPLIDLLETFGFKTINVQYGTGRLNYINGYTAKAHDSLDFRLSELQSDSRWRLTYRLLCKASPCIPEIYCDMAGSQMMMRSFTKAVLYAPIPKPDAVFDNDSKKLYEGYLKAHSAVAMVGLVMTNYMDWSRVHLLQAGTIKKRSDRNKQLIAMGVRFSFELRDNYLGEFMAMFFPHRDLGAFCYEGPEVIEYTKFYSGAMNYLKELRYAYNASTQSMYVAGAKGAMYALAAFPMPLPEATPEDAGKRAFSMADDTFDYSKAYNYLKACVVRDLETRMGPARVDTFCYRLQALAKFYEHIYGRLVVDPIALRDELRAWSATKTITLADRQWSDEQRQALDAIEQGIGISDENVLRQSSQRLFISGEPGAGKSEMLIHAAAKAAVAGLYVLILCPTGALVHSYRDRLPETPHIVVETIHSGMAIYRTYDTVVEYAPPTRLRRYDLILIDEASQIEDKVATMVFVAIGELPQKPFVGVAADFQQLNPITGGSTIRKICSTMPHVHLKTIFRTNDPELLEFLREARMKQPQKETILRFFAGRMLSGTMKEAVAFGLSKARELNKLFSWLCVTNAGADKINSAALSLLGIAEDQLSQGFYGDPKVQASKLYITEGLCIRLTRNIDKEKGFVNGAMGVVEKVLDPEGARAIFTLKLTTGSMLLVHPVRTGERVHLPCAYGYATTIRRCQGSTLDMGCLYFDHSYPPERGYGYVGCSRFRTKANIYHFGKVRRTDWLPVGQTDPMEQTARGPDSIASDTEYDEDVRELEENYEASSEEEKELDYERGYTYIDKDNDYEDSSADSMDEDAEVKERDEEDDDSERDVAYELAARDDTDHESDGDDFAEVPALSDAVGAPDLGGL